MSNVYELLDQDMVWETKDGMTLLVEQMTPGHIHNLLAWFERKAPAIKERLAWHLLLNGPREDSSDAVHDMFEHNMDVFDAQPPLVWLDEKPLIKKLRELQRAYQGAEAKIALSLTRENSQ